jgi:hypothetical protein
MRSPGAVLYLLMLYMLEGVPLHGSARHDPTTYTRYELTPSRVALRMGLVHFTWYKYVVEVCRVCWNRVQKWRVTVAHSITVFVGTICEARSSSHCSTCCLLLNYYACWRRDRIGEQGIELELCTFTKEAQSDFMSHHDNFSRQHSPLSCKCTSRLF